MNNDKSKNIYYLDELDDYQVSNDDKDVRGWEVHDKDGRLVGEVENLIVNKQTERTVYLDVEVDDSIIDANFEPYQGKANQGQHVYLNEDGDNYLIIPIGMAELNLDDEIVYTKTISHDTFSRSKRKKSNLPIKRDYELLVLETYQPDENYDEYHEGDRLYERDEFRY